MLEVQEHLFHVGARSALSPSETRVLKQGDSFAVLDRHGDLLAPAEPYQGLFYRGARYLSRCLLRIAGVRPLILNSLIKHDNLLFMADLTNAELNHEAQPQVLAMGEMHLFRSK